MLKNNSQTLKGCWKYQKVGGINEEYSKENKEI